MLHHTEAIPQSVFSIPDYFSGVFVFDVGDSECGALSDYNGACERE